MIYCIFIAVIYCIFVAAIYITISRQQLYSNGIYEDERHILFRHFDRDGNFRSPSFKLVVCQRAIDWVQAAIDELACIVEALVTMAKEGPGLPLLP